MPMMPCVGEDQEEVWSRRGRWVDLLAEVGEIRITIWNDSRAWRI